MWENIVQSVRKVRSGDKGLGCILAHTMGLGKTFQVKLLSYYMSIFTSASHAMEPCDFFSTCLIVVSLMDTGYCFSVHCYEMHRSRAENGNDRDACKCST